MHRNAAHGDIVALMFAAFGQGDIQRLGGGNSIVKEHLVKVAHPVKQQGIAMLCFDFQKLRHHGRDLSGCACHGFPLLICRADLTKQAQSMKDAIPSFVVQGAFGR